MHTLPAGVPVVKPPEWINGGGGNPGGVPSGNYVHTGSTPLPGGTYRFNNLTIDLQSTLTFTGPASLYVRGDVILRNGGSALAYRSIPANLRIYQDGSGVRFETFNNAVITAVVIAPGSAFIANNNFIFRGACLFDSITCWNNGEFYFDETAGEVAALSLVQ